MHILKSMQNTQNILVKLVHIKGPMKGNIQEFHEDRITIGRQPFNHLRFPADLDIVSRNHAEIIRDGIKFKLIDHSSNGTYVNGKNVNEVFLKNGDVIEFANGGPKVSFLTELKKTTLKRDIQLSNYHHEVSQKKQQPFLDNKHEFLHHIKEREIIIQKVNAPLIIQYGPTIRTFKELPVTIGKNPMCQYKLDHPEILDQHAQIFFNQNQYWIKDLTGQGVVHVNKQPIALQTHLNLNDEISLSQKGPVFSFLGEGRLAEVLDAKA